MDDLKLKRMEISDWKKRFAEVDSKFHQQQNIFEGVRAERNICSKGLVEAQDEIQALKTKLKITHQQMEQTKEDMATKNNMFLEEEGSKFWCEPSVQYSPCNALPSNYISQTANF